MTCSFYAIKILVSKVTDFVKDAIDIQEVMDDVYSLISIIYVCMI